MTEFGTRINCRVGASVRSWLGGGCAGTITNTSKAVCEPRSWNTRTYHYYTATALYSSSGIYMYRGPAASSLNPIQSNPTDTKAKYSRLKKC